MPRILWFALAQAAGIVAADRGLVGPSIALWIGVVAGLGVLAAGRRSRVRLVLTLVLAGAAGAFGLATHLDEAACARPSRPLGATIEARVVQRVRRGPSVTLALDQAVRADTRAPPVPRRLLLRTRGREPGEEPPLAAALPGERLRMRVRLRAPHGLANPGGRSSERRLARAGVGAVARLVHPALVARLPEAEGWRPLRSIDALRERVGRRLATLGSGSGLVRALALGEREALGEEEAEAFRRLGVAHLLAVSGLHLALVAGLVFGLARRVTARSVWLALRGDPRRLALALAVLAAAGYALLTGFAVPVRRALILLLGVAASVAQPRVVHWSGPLSAAALAVLAFDPGALFDPGAELSFVASAALLAAAREDPGDGPGVSSPRRLSRALRVSATALVATAPLAAARLGSVTPWALVANLVLVPWTGIVLLPTALAAAGVAAWLPSRPPASWVLAAAVHIAAATQGLLVAVAARLPATAVGPPGAGPLCLATGLAALALARRSTRARVMGALATSTLLLLAPPARVSPAAPRAVFFDVGLGDSALVQGRHGSVLVDAAVALPGGPDLGRLAVVPALRALGVRKLDLLVVSHGDLDHRGGVPSVLRRLPVGQVWIPRGTAGSRAFAALRAAARARGVPVLERGAGDAPARFGDVRVVPLGPPLHAEGLSRNDRSLVVRMDVGSHRVLFLGDVEAAGERALLARDSALHVDVLKLAHHGSQTSSTPGLLAASGAAVAVASAPWDASRPLPHPKALARVRRAGAALWWTGRDGAVLVALGSPLWVRGWREPAEGELGSPSR